MCILCVYLCVLKFKQKEMKIAVYGTLRKGFHNHVLLDNCYSRTYFLGNGVIDGYLMYDLGVFPTVIKGDGSIVVEVYEVDEITMLSLDRLEGFRGEGSDANHYDKILENVTMEDGTRTEAFLYYYSEGVSENSYFKPKLIPSGDYIDVVEF